MAKAEEPSVDNSSEEISTESLPSASWSSPLCQMAGMDSAVATMEESSCVCYLDLQLVTLQYRLNSLLTYLPLSSNKIITHRM